ncbi:GtrA family protein [Actinomadura algeriensis]|uniref:Flippase GtrA n=1 Tax=Actinomadura algeriensis TaxID=1679523 RepID=A0ABR9JQX9_9ACTN|nr:GtrA family protein [Actinomadura algeriensis]MBE1532984.1 putative flippase GtrA [Actinomadura algeriensis]
MPRHLPRILRFVSVGGLCFSLQYAFASALGGTGTPWPVANAAGFLTSAQLNFLLSSTWTWRDRTVRIAWPRWAAYHASVLLALSVNTVVFLLAYRRTGPLPAALLGVLAGGAANYLACDLGVFRPRTAPLAYVPEQASR